MNSAGKRTLIFVTGNPNKLKEVRHIFINNFVTPFCVDRPFLAIKARAIGDEPMVASPCLRFACGLILIIIDDLTLQISDITMS